MIKEVTFVIFSFCFSNLILEDYVNKVEVEVTSVLVT